MLTKKAHPIRQLFLSLYLVGGDLNFILGLSDLGKIYFFLQGEWFSCTNGVSAS